MDSNHTYRSSIVSVALALIALGVSTPARATAGFSDGDFFNDWYYATFTAGTGGSALHYVSGPDGNPGYYLVIQTSLPGQCGAVYEIALKSSATYDPSASGALESFDYSEDTKMIDGIGGGQATGPAIYQNGHYYVYPGWATGLDQDWHHMSRSGLTSGDFIEILGGPCPSYTDPFSHPDFSDSGSEMTFGFYRGNSQIDGYGAYTITAAIDNWRVHLGPPKYVALGDSYSSGEGVDPFFIESDIPGDRCHRSPAAYGYGITFPGVQLKDEDFIACSGAETVNVLPAYYGGQPPKNAPGEQPQLDAFEPPPHDNSLVVGSDTDMITISVGGNDLGFSVILTKCFLQILPPCDSDAYHPFHGSNMTLRQYVAMKLDYVSNQLAKTYGAITSQAPNASVFVMGYPHIFGSDSDCQGLNAPFTPTERAWLDSVGDALNQEIAWTAADYNVWYVPVAGSFQSHGVCSHVPWINGMVLPPRFYASFHPTAMGQHVYALRLSTVMKTLVAQHVPVNEAGIPKNPGSSEPSAAAARGKAPLTVPPSLATLLVEPSGTLPCNTLKVYVPGEQVHLTGTDFDGFEAVTVRLETGAYVSAFATPTTDGFGDLDTVVTLPADAPTSGDAQITVEGFGPYGELRQLVAQIRLSTSFTADADGDGIPDPCDNCPTVSTSNTTDSDGDGIGDACDPCPNDLENDNDNDGLCANVDPCPWDPENDADGDGFCEVNDNCPTVANASQADSDGDGVGDACDAAPLDPGVFAPVTEVAGLSFDDGATMNWTTQAYTAGPITTYDVIRGNLSDLPSGYSGNCVTSGTLNATAADHDLPDPDTGFWYLVRAVNAIGTGTYGYASDGTERIALSCP